MVTRGVVWSRHPLSPRQGCRTAKGTSHNMAKSQAVEMQEMRDRIGDLERLVNVLDREAEVLEEHVEGIDTTINTFRYAIAQTMVWIWGRTRVNELDDYNALWPEIDPAGFRQVPAWMCRWNPSDRRVRLYGSRAELLELAMSMGVKVEKRGSRSLLIWRLRRAGVEVDRADAVGTRLRDRQVA